jgi:hypothetical protein
LYLRGTSAADGSRSSYIGRPAAEHAEDRRVLSINVWLPREMEWKGRRVTTGIFAD